MLERKRINMKNYSLAGLKSQVIELIELLRGALYPEIFDPNSIGDGHEKVDADMSEVLLRKLLMPFLEDEEKCRDIAKKMTRSLPEIKEVLKTDVQAAYEGDPAAKSEEEVMLAYPGFEAISVFRLAHRLYELNVPILPRMMTEYAHTITGIDIHPGAVQALS